MNLKQWAGFLTLTVIWGSSFLWIKVAVQELGPLTVVTIRLVFALLALSGFLIARAGWMAPFPLFLGMLLILLLVLFFTIPADVPARKNALQLGKCFFQFLTWIKFTF